MARNDIEDQITNQLAKEMAADIDRNMLWSMLQASGWTKVAITRFVDNVHAIDIRIWIEEYRTDEVLQHGREFLFKEPKDATMFILRWADASR